MPSQWPIPLNANLLDSRHWTYLAEGGKNLLLRYEGPVEYPFVSPSGSRLALRLSKVDRADEVSTSKTQESSDIDAIQWKRLILEPDLSREDVLPHLLPVVDDSPDLVYTRGFLNAIASKVESMRPMERRRASKLDEMPRKDCILMTEDLSGGIAGKQVISFEVKPKCGFMPSSSTHLSPDTGPIKRSYSRYRMHRVMKSKLRPTLDEFESYYDPLDLYSGEESRVSKASTALYNDWMKGKGNLRIFVNGKRAGAEEESNLDELVKVQFEFDSLKGMVGKLLKGDQVKHVLSRLVFLQQRYDDLDVEGVSSLCQLENGVPLAEAMEPSVSLDEYLEAVQSGSSQPSRARQAIVKLLLSAMYKDCSMFIRCTSSLDRHSLHSSVHLVDLDPKPVTKLAYFEQLDRDICQSFREWAKSIGL
jgi:inositol-pentakisphosphate 2-kinase